MVIGKNKIFIKLLLLALVIIFSCTGMAYARWTDGLDISSTVATGNIDPIFTSFEVCKYNASNNNPPQIFRNDKDIIIEITDAHPNYWAYFNYTIENKGSVPVELNIESIGSDGILIINKLEQEGDRAEGLLKVELPKREEGILEYVFRITLNFKQAVGN